MPITQTGTTLTFAVASTANSGTVSSTITVPADAEIVLVGVSTYLSVANSMSSGSMTFTKNSADTAMTAGVGADASTLAFQGTLFYLGLPDTGANKSLKWDWAGTTAMDNAPLVSVTFWKGIDTSSPVRHIVGMQSTTFPFTSPTLTAQSGDLIVAWCHFYSGAAGSRIDSWTNLTLLSQLTENGQSDAAWATGSPSGNTTVEAVTATDAGDGGISAAVLKPAGSSSPVASAYYYRMLNG